jgi:hypothetical protein
MYKLANATKTNVCNRPSLQSEAHFAFGVYIVVLLLLFLFCFWFWRFFSYPGGVAAALRDKEVCWCISFLDSAERRNTPSQRIEAPPLFWPLDKHQSHQPIHKMLNTK